MELYCIKTHSQKAVLKGQIYQMISDKCPCKCDSIDVGIRNTLGQIIGRRYICSTCNTSCIEDGIWWICKSLFANIDEISLEEVEEILNGELVEKI